MALMEKAMSEEAKDEKLPDREVELRSNKIFKEYLKLSKRNPNWRRNLYRSILKYLPEQPKGES